MVLVLLCVSFASVHDMAGYRKLMCDNFEGVSSLKHECTCCPIDTHIIAHMYCTDVVHYPKGQGQGSGSCGVHDDRSQMVVASA